jgi:molybdopterin molybdotransferase
LAENRILAEPIISDRRLPPWPVAAMDGYALHAADLEPARGAIAVTREIAAGATPGSALAAGETARIFTGAPLPPGSAAVVRQEDTECEGGKMTVRVAVKPGENVREAGEDIDIGDRVLDAGTSLGPAALGVLASVGKTTVSVYQTPRVALLSSGDELIEPDGDPGAGQIVSSNSYSLAAQVRAAGAEAIYPSRPRGLGLRADLLGSQDQTRISARLWSLWRKGALGVWATGQSRLRDGDF